ncbi:MFS transporter [Paraburkholderia sp.]|uniref:MFS transporter n=1 Tax=Paraburkholderia sp. TaxID=1926495 RepID=UPI002F4137C0
MLDTTSRTGCASGDDDAAAMTVNGTQDARGSLCRRPELGISAGGEFGTATAMLAEYAPKRRRSFYGSWQMFAQALGALIAIAMGAVLSNLFSKESVESWAWRLPFVLGLLIGPIGIYIRNRMPETEAFSRLSKPARAPLSKVLSRYPREVFISATRRWAWHQAVRSDFASAAPHRGRA